MAFRPFFRPKPPDVEAMKREGDIRGLMKAFRHPDTGVQWRAAEALGSLGPDAIHQLIRGLRTRNRAVKLGIIGALGEIKDPQAVEPLLREFQNPSAEVRWETALALGEIGDTRAISPLVISLHDQDRFVRYGAALALGKLHWIPGSDEERALYFLGLQDWEGLATLGPPAIPALDLALKDREKTVRRRAVETLGKLRNEAAIPAIFRGLKDLDEDVRWQAVLAGPRCGINIMHLPRGLSLRPRLRKSPSIAAFLNCVLPGMGYFYLGRWWGILIFQIDITATLWLFAFAGEQPSYSILLPIYCILAVHGWFLAKRMPEI